MKPFARLLPLLIAVSSPLAAGRIDVSNQTFAWVHPGAGVEIHFGVWSYGWNNPGYSPYPTQLGLEIIGQLPSSLAAPIPDSTAAYFPGLLFTGWLESLDGTVSVPLYDPNADRLGLPVGTLLVSPGTFSAGGDSPLDVAVLAAFVSMSQETSEALFGANIGSRTNAALIRLDNIGQGFTVGIGPGYTARNSVSEPGIAGLGPAQTAGTTGQVEVVNPEPSTWLTLACALVLLGFLRRRRAAIRSRT